jgi:hypothetical protein
LVTGAQDLDFLFLIFTQSLRFILNFQISKRDFESIQTDFQDIKVLGISKKFLENNHLALGNF